MQDRYQAIQWLQAQLSGIEGATPLVDALNEAWHTMDTLGAHLLPESVLMLLLARPTDKQPDSSEEPTFTLQQMTLSEFFELISACSWYDTELRRRGESSDTEKAAIAALERLHQRLLTVTVQQPPQEEAQEDNSD
jgi:hypothetical protein